MRCCYRVYLVDCIDNYDLICIQETKLDDVDSINLDGYTIFTHNRKKISRYRSGGIALLANHHMSHYIKIQNSTSPLIYLFSISKTITPTQDDIVCGIVYIPPFRSRYAHEDPYLAIQRQLEILCQNSKYIVLLGDFNSRTSNLEDIVQADEYLNDFYGNYELTNESLQILHSFERYNISVTRENADSTVNAYGYKIIDFCKSNDIYILNGRTGSTSKFTCKDCSTTDYVLMTPKCFELMKSLAIDDFNCLYSDSHCPVSVSLNILCPTRDKSIRVNTKKQRKRTDTTVE